MEPPATTCPVSGLRWLWLGTRHGRRPGWSGAETGAQARPGAGPRAGSGASRLDEGEKVLSLWDEVLSVVAPYMGAVAVQGVQESDGEGLGHALADLVGGEP